MIKQAMLTEAFTMIGEENNNRIFEELMGF
jgi:hypothetical protein